MKQLNVLVKSILILIIYLKFSTCNPIQTHVPCIQDDTAQSFDLSLLEGSWYDLARSSFVYKDKTWINGLSVVKIEKDSNKIEIDYNGLDSDKNCQMSGSFAGDYSNSTNIAQIKFNDVVGSLKIVDSYKNGQVLIALCFDGEILACKEDKLDLFLVSRTRSNETHEVVMDLFNKYCIKEKINVVFSDLDLSVCGANKSAEVKVELTTTTTTSTTTTATTLTTTTEEGVIVEIKLDEFSSLPVGLNETLMNTTVEAAINKEENETISTPATTISTVASTTSAISIENSTAQSIHNESVAVEQEPTKSVDLKAKIIEIIQNNQTSTDLVLDLNQTSILNKTIVSLNETILESTTQPSIANITSATLVEPVVAVVTDSSTVVPVTSKVENVSVHENVTAAPEISLESSTVLNSTIISSTALPSSVVSVISTQAPAVSTVSSESTTITMLDTPVTLITVVLSTLEAENKTSTVSNEVVADLVANVTTAKIAHEEKVINVETKEKEADKDDVVVLESEKFLSNIKKSEESKFSALDLDESSGDGELDLTEPFTTPRAVLVTTSDELNVVLKKQNSPKEDETKATEEKIESSSESTDVSTKKAENEIDEAKLDQDSEKKEESEVKEAEKVKEESVESETTEENHKKVDDEEKAEEKNEAKDSEEVDEEKKVETKEEEEKKVDDESEPAETKPQITTESSVHENDSEEEKEQEKPKDQEEVVEKNADESQEEESATIEPTTEQETTTTEESTTVEEITTTTTPYPCVAVQCPIVSCTYGRKKDPNGCDLCDCLPNPSGNTSECSTPYCHPCFYGAYTDENGCESCACKPRPKPKNIYECPKLDCVSCNYGSIKDEYGCETCICIRPNSLERSYPCPPEPTCPFGPCKHGSLLNEYGCATCDCLKSTEPDRDECHRQRCPQCPHGYYTDSDGCETCSCKPDWMAPCALNQLSCDLSKCQYGNYLDRNGCPSCECLPNPDFKVNCVEMAELNNETQCSSDGTFKHKQCNDHECRCVTKDGIPISDFKAPLDESEFMNCECALALYDVSVYKAIGFKLYCSANGNYETIQCVGGSCACVNEHGDPLGPSVPIYQKHLLRCEGVFQRVYYDQYLTTIAPTTLVPPLCVYHRERALEMSSIDAHLSVPVCDEKGLYEPMQCDRQKKYCWCVNVHNGVELYGTKKTGEKPNCASSG